MIYGFNQGLFGLAAMICAGLYGVKHEARITEKDLGRLSVSIEEERQQLRLLEAEWAMRTQPERLQRLAERHLEIEPLAPRQILALPALSDAALPPLDADQVHRQGPAGPSAPARLANRGAEPLSGRRVVFSLDRPAEGPRLAQNTGPAASPDGASPFGLKATSRLAGAGAREGAWRAR
ncbi:MAG: hypothetical protein ACFB6R_01970 [Alphaproteobacteria bacterium]